MSNISLVVGTDGVVGAALEAAARNRGMEVWGTSRRKDAAGLRKSIYLDLAEPGLFQLPIPPRSAFLCAANSAFLECEKNGDATYRVNVTGCVALSRQLLSDGAFVILLSSSAVFDGLQSFPESGTVPTPTTAYGKQKAEAERQLLEIDAGGGNVAIVRLTKVFTAETPVIRRFLQNLTKRERFDAFGDLYISPISRRYVVESLLDIERRKLGGIHHLSGDIELSYADFARRLAGRLGVSVDLVGESTVEQSPVPVLYRPLHPALGMALDSGMRPEPIDAMLDNLSNDVAARP